MDCPSTKTGWKAWMPKRCRVGARFKRTTLPWITSSKASHTSSLMSRWRSSMRRAALTLGAMPFSSIFLRRKGLKSSRAIRLGRPHWWSLSWGPTTITLRPE